MQGGAASNAFGLDVSEDQRFPDWAQVRAAGKHFAIARATYGVTIRDPSFAYNWAGLRAVGLRRSAYHFAVFGAVDATDPIADAQHQAAVFLAAVDAAGGIQGGDLSPFVDAERGGNPHGWTGAQQVAWVTQWCNAVDAAVKNPAQRAGLYGSPSFLAGWATAGAAAVADLAQRPLWLARWDPMGDPANLLGWDRWQCWQYSNQGRVPGIAGAVDLDEWASALTLDPISGTRVTQPPTLAQQVTQLATELATVQAQLKQLDATVQGETAAVDTLTAQWAALRIALASLAANLSR